VNGGVSVKMLQNRSLLVIGDTSLITDQLAKEVSLAENLEYYGLYSGKITKGCYQIGVSDLSLNELIVLSKKFDQVMILDLVDSEVTLQLNLLRLYLSKKQDSRLTLDKNCLLFAGCSHSVGVGIAEKRNTYSHILSSDLQMVPVNISRSGSSNYAIENSLSKFNLSQANVIVQFSNIDRIEYVLNNSLRSKLGGNYTIHESNVFTDERNFLSFQQLVMRVYARLKDSNAKFVMIYFDKMHQYTNSALQFLMAYDEFCWIPEPKLDLGDDNFHYGLISQENIAMFVKNKWQELYYEKT